MFLCFISVHVPTLVYFPVCFVDYCCVLTCAIINTSMNACYVYVNHLTMSDQEGSSETHHLMPKVKNCAIKERRIFTFYMKFSTVILSPLLALTKHEAARMSLRKRNEMDRPTHESLVYLTRVKPHYIQNAGF